MNEENLKQIREVMKQEGFTEEQIKQYEIRMLLSQVDYEEENEDVELISFEDIEED